MKVYRFHRCRRQHRSGSSFIRCALKRAEWVHGDGTFAVIAWCSYVTVTLWETAAEATTAKAEIDAGGCSGKCVRKHDVIRIDLQGI